MSSNVKTEGWWFWLLLGCLGLVLTIGGAAFFGVTVREVLLGREIVVLWPLTIDYLLIGWGSYLGVRRLLSALRERISST